jgi:hypothetical protein
MLSIALLAGLGAMGAAQHMGRDGYEIRRRPSRERQPMDPDSIASAARAAKQAAKNGRRGGKRR